MTLEDLHKIKKSASDSDNGADVSEIDVRNVTFAEFKRIIRNVMDSHILRDFVKQYQELLRQKDLGSEEGERFEEIVRYLKRRINFVDERIVKRRDSKYHQPFKANFNV